jgi:hypothetical protein
MSEVLLLKNGKQWFSKEELRAKYAPVLKQLINE